MVLDVPHSAPAVEHLKCFRNILLQDSSSCQRTRCKLTNNCKTSCNTCMRSFAFFQPSEMPAKHWKLWCSSTRGVLGLVCPASSCRLDLWNHRKLLQSKCQHTRVLACSLCSIAAAYLTSRKSAFPCTNLHGLPSRSRHHVICILNSLAKRCSVLCSSLQIVAKLQQNAQRP